MSAEVAAPKRQLATLDAVAITVGVVVGAGIFRLPSLVASQVATELQLMAMWVAGGLISLIGVLCYAELATAYPHAGGDYFYIRRAYGDKLSFLFAWARMTVIQTGSIALGAFLIGDYLSQVATFGTHSSAVYAAIVVALVTALNVLGLKHGRATQALSTLLSVGGLLALALFGLALVPPHDAPPTKTGGALGLAMVFVLLTYGGWNEAVYMSAEVQDRRRGIVKALISGVVVVTLLYVLLNWALVRGLGLSNMAASEAVAADYIRSMFGEPGAIIVSILIAVAAFSTTNATVITGARTNYALGNDYSLFKKLGHWDGRCSAPTNALLFQGFIALGLIILGAATTRSGFETMIGYTAPVFWFFFFLVGLATIILRRKDGSDRPYKMPLYPLTPLVFCSVCLYMLYSSLAYTGWGALVGVGVLLAGVPVMLLAKPRTFPEQQTEERSNETVTHDSSVVDTDAGLRERDSGHGRTAGPRQAQPRRSLRSDAPADSRRDAALGQRPEGRDGL